MTDHQKRKEIISLLSFLQTFIQNNVDQSFTDLSFDLETVIKDYLNVFEKDTEKYRNLNGLKYNYPAIDLINDKRDIALQVTTNADLRKVKKTLETYKKHNISYSTLIIIGFVNYTKAKLANVTIHGIDYLIQLAKFGTNTQLDSVFEILKRQIPWNSLSPLDDKHCFDVVFDIINRSAVRDDSEREGSYERMVAGLFEIKEIITTGRITGKSTRAKTLGEYSDKVKRKLSEIEFDVSSILQICNRNKNQRHSDFLCLTLQETDSIDELKEKIIIRSNELATDMKLNKKIIGGRRR